MKNMGLFLLVFVLATPLMAQSNTESIVRLKDASQILNYELENGVKLTEISKDLGLYQATQNNIPRSLTKSALRQKSVTPVYSVPNHKVTLRAPISKVTSDPLILEQWNLGLDEGSVGVNAVDAWAQFGSRHYDRSFNDVVIAVVDGGFDINHPDLLYNKWTNTREIAGNGKDDDGNGYVDDINGWDVSSNSGKIFSADHGTHVAGIMGARGNNSRGISGVNQRARIMFVSSGNLGDTASTMRAYSYILAQKKLWNQSGGRKGANVVVVNSSFGIDGVQCSQGEFVIWNDMINELGKAGILSVGATSNFEVNVDKLGDVPTSCDSPYQLAVTNSNRDGTKATGVDWDTISEPQFENLGAGYGKNHIDLAAPGDEILSTAERLTSFNSQLYTAQSGTSYSAPHVAGAIGYLHSVASLSFNKRYMRNPAAGALELKAAILSTVTPLPGMTELTRSGGILNIYEASLALQAPSVLLSSAN